MNCTGTVKIVTESGVTLLMCSDTAGHRGDHYDAIFSVRWPEGTQIGTCHLPPAGGTERVE